MPIVPMLLCSARRGRFSIPAVFHVAVARSLGRDWPQATGAAGAQRSWRRQARRQHDRGRNETTKAGVRPHLVVVALVEGTNIVRRELGLPETRVRAADRKLYLATAGS
jgi:hypothetical protein